MSKDINIKVKNAKETSSELPSDTTSLESEESITTTKSVSTNNESSNDVSVVQSKNNDDSHSSKDDSEKSSSSNSNKSSNSDHDLDEQDESLINAKPTKMDENTEVFSDSLIDISVRSSLSIMTDSDDLQQEAELKFKNYYSMNSISAFPDEDLSYMKATSDVEQYKKLCTIPYFKNQMWGSVIEANFKAINAVTSSIDPVPKYILNDLNRALGSSKTFSSEYICGMLTHTQDLLSSVVYGSSHGTQDISYFIATKYDSLSLKYEYTAQLQNESKNETVLTIWDSSNKKIEKHEHKVSNGLLSFPESNINMPDKHADFNRSIFMKENFKHILLDLVQLKTECEDIVFMQHTTSSREATVVKSQSDTTYIEGFTMNLVVNDDINITIHDRIVVDCLMGIMHYYPIISGEEHREQLDQMISFVSTVIHFYIKSIPIIKQGVKIKSVEFKVEMVRTDNDQDSLTKKFQDFVNRGLIIPMSPLQFSLYLGKTIPESWTKIIGLTSLSTPYASDNLRTVIPHMDRESKSLFSRILRDPDMRESYWYSNKVSIPFAKDLSIKISAHDVIMEMHFRLMTNDSICQSIPLFTRGAWPCGSGTTPTIQIAQISQLYCKLALNNSDVVTDIVVKHLCFRSTKGGAKVSPYYIKGTSRASKDMLKIFERFVPNQLSWDDNLETEVSTPLLYDFK